MLSRPLVPLADDGLISNSSNQNFLVNRLNRRHYQSSNERNQCLLDIKPKTSCFQIFVHNEKGRKGVNKKIILCCLISSSEKDQLNDRKVENGKVFQFTSLKSILNDHDLFNQIKPHLPLFLHINSKVLFSSYFFASCKLHHQTAPTKHLFLKCELLI